MRPAGRSLPTPALSNLGKKKSQCLPNGIANVENLDLQQIKESCMFRHEYGQNPYFQNIDLQKKGVRDCLEITLLKIFTFIKNSPSLMLCPFLLTKYDGQILCDQIS